MGIYSATKGFLRELSMSFKNTLTVSPGAVDTQMTAYVGSWYPNPLVSSPEWTARNSIRVLS